MHSNERKSTRRLLERRSHSRREQKPSRLPSNRFKMLLWSQVTFLLLLYVMESVRATSVSPSLLQPPITRVRFIEVEDDYDVETSKTTHTPQSPGVTATHGSLSEPCDYDPCVVQTTPCDKISAQTGCLCPGLTGPEKIPKTPELREVKLDASGQVVVHWCAPLSSVTYYNVTLNGGKGQIFGEYLRNGVIPGLKIGETVCVAAGNQAGLSEKSCTRYEPPQHDQTALSAGIIAGCAAFLLLLLVLTVVLWRRRTCRKGRMGEAEGLGNPSYTNDGAL